MIFSQIDDWAAVPTHEMHAVNPDPTAYLKELVQTFSLALQTLEKLTDKATSIDVENGALDVHLAHRSTISEFRALQIDGIRLDGKQVDHLRSLHETAVATLGKNIKKSPLVSTYLDSIKQRLNDLSFIQ